MVAGNRIRRGANRAPLSEEVKDMTNTHQTTASTAENRTSDKESSVIEKQVTGLTLRSGRPEDAEDCGSICYEAFKAIAEGHNFPPTFPRRRLRSGWSVRCCCATTSTRSWPKLTDG